MQKQDKALYSQLLTLRESIRGLKTELKKEREQCEEAFKDLEEISGTDFEDDVFVEGTVHWEDAKEKNEDALSAQETWRHDRQDSGISVKTPEAEIQESCTSDECFKPEVISHGKQHINLHVKTIKVELPQKKISNTKPVLIHHHKQDSGILIDEDVVRETKLLSKLVESSEMLEKLENQKIDRIIQKKWNKVRENSPANAVSHIHHQRSRSNNDLLKFQRQRGLVHQHSTPDLQTLYSLKNSCPQIKLFSAQGTEVNFDNPTFHHFNEHKRLIPNHSRTSSCPQSTLKQFTKSIKPPNELVNAKGLESDEKQQQSKLPDEVKKTLEHVEKLRKDESLNQSHPSTPRDHTSLFLALKSGSGSSTSKSVFKQNFIPKHQHTRSLPATPIRELSVTEDLLSRQERSVQNISDYSTITSKQIRPRKRSASFVDLDSLKEKESSDLRSSFATSKENDVHNNSLQQTNETEQNKVGFSRESLTIQQKNEGKRTRENNNTGIPCKANVVQVESFSDFKQTGNSSDDLARDHESSRNKTLTSYKANVVRVNSLPQGNKATTLIPNKAKVVHITNLKQPQENAAQSNTPVEMKAPLRSVVVSAAEVSVSNVTDRHTLSRRCSMDDKGIGSLRLNERSRRRLTISSYKTERISPRSKLENGEFSSRLLAPKNHIRHHTMPEYEAIRHRHSLYSIHAPSKSWDGYAHQKPNEFNRMVRSVSQVSFV